MIWRSMFDDSCRGTMLARLRSLGPDTPRRWGRMTAPQMVAHLTDQMHHALGDSPVQARPGPLRWAAVRRGDENVATPREMALLLEAVHKGKVLDPGLAADFLKQLSTPKEGGSDIPRYPPDGVRVANKPGSLAGVRTDSGIVFAEGRPFALSVMTAYDRDERAAELAISEVALAAYRFFEMLGKASEHGRVLPPAEAGK